MCVCVCSLSRLATSVGGYDSWDFSLANVVGTANSLRHVRHCRTTPLLYTGGMGVQCRSCYGANWGSCDGILRLDRHPTNVAGLMSKWPPPSRSALHRQDLRAHASTPLSALRYDSIHTLLPATPWRLWNQLRNLRQRNSSRHTSRWRVYFGVSGSYRAAQPPLASAPPLWNKCVPGKAMRNVLTLPKCCIQYHQLDKPADSLSGDRVLARNSEVSNTGCACDCVYPPRYNEEQPTRDSSPCTIQRGKQLYAAVVGV